MKSRKGTRFRFFVSLLLASSAISLIACGNWFGSDAANDDDHAPGSGQVDLFAAIPPLDVSMVPASEPSASMRALSVESAEDAKRFLDEVMSAKMYADAINGIAGWVKASAADYPPDIRNEINETIHIDIPGFGSIPIYICTLAYTLGADELNVYLFFPEPPATDPAESNPLRIQIRNKLQSDGSFVADFSWASYDDGGTPGASENDYLSSYFFRVDTGSGRTFFYTGSSDTAGAASYGELEIVDAAKKYGSLKIISPDEAGGVKRSILRSDADGYYVHLDEELSGFEDGGSNIGKFHFSRTFAYDADFADWPDEFLESIASFGSPGSAELTAMSSYDPADFIPAFDDPMFALIWPDEWLGLLQGP